MILVIFVMSGVMWKLLRLTARAPGGLQLGSLVLRAAAAAC